MHSLLRERPMTRVSSGVLRPWAFDGSCRVQGQEPVIGCFNEPPNRPQHARLAGNSLHSCRRGAAVRGKKAFPSLPVVSARAWENSRRPGMSSSASFAVPRPKSMRSQPPTSRPIRSLLTSSLISPPESRSGSAALAISLNTSRVRIVACFGAGVAVGPFSSARCLRVVSSTGA